MEAVNVEHKKEVKKVPQLRFPEFIGVWENNILGAIAHFSKGKGISKSDIVENGALECIRYGELYTDYGEVIDNVKSRTNISADDLVLSQENDVLIPASGETQIDIATASCVLKSGVALSGDLNIIKSPVNGVFLSYYLNSIKKIDIARLSQGISVVHIYSSQLKTLKLKLPKVPEQQKIASFLSAVDKKIQQLTRKKELLEQYKKGVMQKIFSQEIRFKPALSGVERDDDGNEYPDWELKKLGEIAEFQKGKGISKADIDKDGNTDCIRYGELYTKYTEVINEVFSKTNLSLKQLTLSKDNDVIIPASGESHIDIATASCITRPGIAIGGDINIIRTKENGTFLAYYLNNQRKKDIARLSQGISVVHLYSSQLKMLKILIPNISEQQKIAGFINSISDKIELVNTHIQMAKSFKKGLLQQMFV
jgi:type I restriction enzyme S subunit